jgi:hypothetical protein
MNAGCFKFMLKYPGSLIVCYQYSNFNFYKT